MNEVPKTQFLSRCEECLHWEKNHILHKDGAVSCSSCGLCYRPEQQTVFLTMEQFAAKYPDTAMCHESNW